MTDARTQFIGAIPEHYDRYLGPAWFDAFAADLVRRLPSKLPGDVLEIACGTGRVTRRLRERLDPSVRLVATDLSPAMLGYARATLSASEGIDWREADATRLPFADRLFSAVVCGFGVMFAPDREAAFKEVRRVLKDDGLFLFNVWDRIEENPHALASAAVIEGLFPGEEGMQFRTPFEMHDRALLRGLLVRAGFQDIRLETTRIQLGQVSARTIAIGSIRGTPRSQLLESRGVSLDDVVDQVTAALVKLGGADPYRGSAQAIVAEAGNAAA